MQMEIKRQKQADKDLDNLAKRAVLEHRTEFPSQQNPVDLVEVEDFNSANVTKFVNTLDGIDQIVDYFE